jgi:hypothetical protein
LSVRKKRVLKLTQREGKVLTKISPNKEKNELERKRERRPAK